MTHLTSLESVLDALHWDSSSSSSAGRCDFVLPTGNEPLELGRPHISWCRWMSTGDLGEFDNCERAM